MMKSWNASALNLKAFAFFILYSFAFFAVKVMAAQVTLTVANWSDQTTPMLGPVKPETCFCHKHSIMLCNP